MPMIKFLSGNSPTVQSVYDYLYKDGRALADDGISLDMTEQIDGPWYDQMDRKRCALGTQRPYGRHRTCRRYEHIVISADPRDRVSLDDFRDFIGSLVNEWFDNPSRIGSYQVAVVYHDDNSERILKGEEGILHAHIVVNNPDLSGEDVRAHRLSGRLSNKFISGFCDAVNTAALERGWHGFAENGRSMTAEEMREEGLKVSHDPHARRKLLQSMDIPDYRVSVPGESVDTNSRTAAGSERARAAGAQTASARSEQDSGRVAKSPADPKGPPRTPAYDSLRDASSRPRTRQARLYDKAEREHLRREEWSWKEDIRARVDCAMRLANSISDFKEICQLLGVGMTVGADGGVKFSHPTAPDTRQVRGATLGAAYTAEAIVRELSLRHAATTQRATYSGTGRVISHEERDATIRAAAEVPTDSREGTAEFRSVAALTAYNDAHGIRSYADYPDTDEGRAACAYAHTLGLFDHGHAPRRRRARTAAEANAQAAWERQERGEGGDNAFNRAPAAAGDTTHGRTDDTDRTQVRQGRS
ncbi:MAG: hypothetical protein Q4B30_06765 [Coriobacteriaceae bacterium]|nr:hypothetical protein [Coriobacteriaceae bacterium]